MIPFAGVEGVIIGGFVEGAIQGAIVGAIVGLVAGLLIYILKPAKPCPQCEKPLPKPLFSPVQACPSCGCELDAKGNRRNP